MPYQQENYPQAEAISYKKDGKWHHYAIDQIIDIVDKISLSALDLGLRKGDKVAIPNTMFEQIQLNSVVKYDTTFSVKVANETAGKGEFLEMEVFPAESLVRGTYLTTLTVGIELPGEKQPVYLSIPIKIVRY